MIDAIDFGMQYGIIQGVHQKHRKEKTKRVMATGIMANKYRITD